MIGVNNKHGAPGDNSGASVVPGGIKSLSDVSVDSHDDRSGASGEAGPPLLAGLFSYRSRYDGNESKTVTRTDIPDMAIDKPSAVGGVASFACDWQTNMPRSTSLKLSGLDADQRRGQVELGGETYGWSVWEGQSLGQTAVVDTETTLIDQHHVPILATVSVSDGVQHFC